MIRSLRWRMQIWHATILAVAISLFATAFYVQLHRSTFGEIDLELLSDARVLEGSLRALRPPMLDGERPDFPQLSLGEGRQSFPPGAGPGPGPGRPGDGRGPGNRPRGPFGPPAGPHTGPQAGPPEQRMESMLQLPPFAARGPRDAPPYYAVFDSSGRLMRSQPTDLKTEWVKMSRSIAYRNEDGKREVLLRGPSDTLIVVGRDIRHHVDRLNTWLLQLILTGGGVLGLGLVGGWWLSRQTIRPIRQISETAGRINAANLSARIATEKMDDEVRSLALILNSMFSRLDQSFQQQSQFTADASHELRTPLAVLMSHCELALSRPRSIEDYKQTIATCQKAGSRMKMLVEDLLTLARADAGKLELHREETDLQLLIRDAVTQLKPLADERCIEIEITGGSTMCSVDARRVSQVIVNLMSNAIHYNKVNGKVSVGTSLDQSHAIITVEDTGVGIPSAALPHLFDRFYRVDEARSRQTGGSGLGLAICKSIIDAHGGEILVDSQLDIGSHFTLRLPLQVNSATDQPSET